MHFATDVRARNGISDFQGISLLSCDGATHGGRTLKTPTYDRGMVWNLSKDSLVLQHLSFRQHRLL